MIAILIAATLAACGGGGGGDEEAPPAALFSAAAAASVTYAAAASTASEMPVSAPAAAPAPAQTTPAPAAAAAEAVASPVYTAPQVTDAAAPAPVVFNATRSARAGDIVSLQGENFGSAPQVWLEALGSTAAQPLAVVNQVGTGWLAVQIPAGVNGALAVRISNGKNTSARVALNAAWPLHLDATQIVPGGAFRVFGRNLLLAGSTPRLRVDGLEATIDLAASDENMLVATAPADVRASPAAQILVDNGNGSGAAKLEGMVAVVAGTNGDPLGLGVGWAAAFSPVMGRNINAASDSRLATRVACDGKTDDSPALQAALVLAARSGGGVVTLPQGVCMLGKGVQLFSRTVLQGAGKYKTELRHSGDSALYGYDADLIALRRFTITNTGTTAASSLNLKTSSRVAVQEVSVNEGRTAKAWLYGITNLVVRDSDFLQTGGAGASGAVHLGGNNGLVFTGNRVSFLNSTGTDMGRSRWVYAHGNTWTRDASRQQDPGVVHTLALNFVDGIALVGNSFTTINGPVDQTKNDSETILTEGGGAARTEGQGRVTSATATTLTDPTARVPGNVWVDGNLPENYGIAIVAGKGAGQSRRVTAFASGTFSVDKAWDVLPDTSSRYATAVWGLQSALIKDNTLTQGPRGIWLYGTAVREVDILGNTLNESGGILLQPYQDQARSMIQPLFNVRIEGNRVSNTLRLYGSYIAVNFANMDGLASGTVGWGIEVRRNTLVANTVNLAPADIPEVGVEGYVNRMRVYASSYDPSYAGLLGSVFQANSCSNCPSAFWLSTGAVGTVLDGSLLSNSPLLWTNQQTASGGLKALFTKVQ